MNNEETIVMKTQNKAQQTINTETSESIENTDNGKIVTATAAAAAMGGALGNSATYAATTMLHDKEAEEQNTEDKVQTTEESVDIATEEPVATVTEEPVDAVVEEPQKTHHAEASKENATVKANTEESADLDYTGNHGADPVTPNAEIHTSIDETGSNETNEVQVLGIYESRGEDGQTMQAAILTNGEDVAAVIDVDGDGVADVLAVDENHNLQIDEGEVYDLSNEHVQMADYQQAYLAQQQEQMQQEHDTFVYNSNEDQPDYNNDADPTFT